MAQHSIGSFQFISLSQPPEGLKQQLGIEARAGVDGVLLRRTGLRGTPFRVRSIVDPPGATTASALNAGFNLYRSYEDLTQLGPQQVVWSGTIDVIHQFQVLDTRLLSLRPVIVPSGGLNAGSALLEVGWTLIPIEI